MRTHIAVLSQYYYPENFRITDICEELVERGYEVTVITGIPNYPEGNFYPGYGLCKRREEVHNGVRIIRLPIISRGKSAARLVLNYFSYVISGWFYKIFSELKADIIYTHEVSPMMQAYVGKWLAKKWSVPSILCVQDLWPESVESTVGITNKHILKWLTNQSIDLYEAYTRILVSSKGYIGAIAKRGIPEDKIYYWPQYAEDIYKPSETKSDLIPQDGRLNITFTGNIGTAQGLEILPATALRLKEIGELVRFNLVGDGRYKENLVHRIKSQGLTDFFNFIPRQPQDAIPSILAASDLGYLSFANKPLFSLVLPAKLQTYLACGVPILASADGESARLILETNTGLVSEAGDVDSLVANIIRFKCLSRDDKMRMKTNAREVAEKEFSRKPLMDELQGHIETLILGRYQ